jgi:transaldolase
MKFFLDTANLDELKKASAWGIIDGVTTNPSLIAREGVPIEEQIRRICDIVDGDVSPFVGRLDVIGANGMELIRQIVTIYRNYYFKTQVLAASLRTTNHVNAAAPAGSHIATAPFKVYDSLFNHPLTDKGLDQFLKDYRKAFETVAV